MKPNKTNHNNNNKTIGFRKKCNSSFEQVTSTTSTTNTLGLAFDNQIEKKNKYEAYYFVIILNFSVIFKIISN